MLNALKAMTAELPRFPHPIQPLVKSDRLDAYRARQIAPPVPKYKRVIKPRRQADPEYTGQLQRLQKMKKERYRHERQLISGSDSIVEQRAWAHYHNQIVEAITYAEYELKRLPIPPRRRLHNGRLPKLNRGRR